MAAYLHAASRLCFASVLVLIHSPLGPMFFIDDSNSTIQYSDAKSIPWNHKVPGIANNSADVTKCYDQT